MQQIAAKMRTPPLQLSDPFDIRTAFDVLGIQRSNALNLYEHGAQLAPQEVGAGTPVAATIAWFKPDGFEAIGHVIALFGWDSQNQTLLVFDPNTVGESDDIIKTVPISEMGNYLEGAESQKRGTWGDGYAVTRDAG